MKKVTKNNGSFQEKRGDREVEQLFRSLELITEIKEGQVSFNIQYIILPWVFNKQNIFSGVFYME